MRTFLEKLHDFFFSDTELEEFLVFRFLFYICSLPYIAFHYLQAFWDFPPHFQSPILIHGLLPFPPVSGSTAPFLYLLIFVTALLAALGLGGAFVRSIFFLSALYVFGNRYCFGVRLGQVDSPLIICAFLFIFARCVQSSASWEYCWPRRCVQLLLVLVIWEAGIAKIRSSGFDWISHDPLRTYLTLRYYPFKSAFSLNTIVPLLKYPLATKAASWGVLFFELTFPLALIRRRVASIYIFALVVFLLTVRVLLGHPFILGLLPLLVAYLPFRHAKVFVSSVLRMRSQFS